MEIVCDRAAARAGETVEQRKLRLEMVCDRAAAARAGETEEQRKLRLEMDCDRAGRPKRKRKIVVVCKLFAKVVLRLVSLFALTKLKIK